MSPKTKSKNPAYPDAHPTAPGGMSQQQLADELIEKHGWTAQEVAQFHGAGKVKWNLRAWPLMIDAVVEGRRAREQEHESLLSNEEVIELFADPIEDDDDLDPDELMAELAESYTGTPDDDTDSTAPEGHSLLIKSPDTLDYIFNGHAGAGPSASERWLHCTASLGASREFLETLTPNQQEQFANSNEAARQGTTAHAAAEVEALAVLGKIEQDEVDATLLELAIEPASGEEYTDEMGEYIVEYVDLVKSYAQDRGDDHVMIEARVSAAVPLTGMHDGEVYEVHGSGDCVVLPTPEDPTLVVADLKYGEGIDVDVEENPQVRIYALGALGLLVDDEGNLITPVEDVTYHIAQPRLGGIKTWSEPLGDLLQWRDEVLAPALTAALYGPAEGAVFAPSENACQWCPARGSCPALAEHRLSAAAELFDVIVEAEYENGPGSFPETTALPDARLGELLSQIEGLVDLRKDLKAEVERRLFRGGQVPGWHLVNYTPPRKWKDGAVEALDEREDLWVKKLITPTAAEKLLGKDEYPTVEPLVEKPDKRPVVAPVGDRRKAWEGRPPEAMFDVEEEK